MTCRAAQNGRDSWGVADIENHIAGALEEAVGGAAALPASRCVYRVPAYLKNLNPGAYEPRVVSFGPYHHGKHHLRLMEGHKRRSLARLLRRCGKPLESFAAAAWEVAQELMDAYEELGEWRDDPANFLGLMVVDGCFMLEVARAFRGMELDETYLLHDDPIFSSHGMYHTMPDIRRDMLLMENQLPLFLLKKLVAVETGRPVRPDGQGGMRGSNSTCDEDDNWINKLLHDALFRKAREYIGTFGRLGLHPLELCRSGMLLHGQVPYWSKSKSSGGGVERQPVGANEDSFIVGTARELSESGIVFVKGGGGGEGPSEIRFDDNGVLTLPGQMVDDVTESVCLNVMAFERLHVGAGREVMSYILFMSSIIRSAKDVALLHSEGIVHNIASGGDEAVAQMLDRLCRRVPDFVKSDHSHVLRRMHQYRRRPWPRLRGYMVRTYFSIPGTGYSLAAALLLLGLTVVQAVYAALQYHHQGHST